MTTERKNEHSPMSEALKDFISHNKLKTGLRKIEVADAWKELMGNGVNNYTKQVYLDGDVLHVSLTSSVLREELSYGKQKIIDMLNEHLKENVIRKIRLH